MNPNDCFKALYQVTYYVAKNKKPYTSREKLILPAVTDICRTMLGDSVAEKLKMIPLSDNTVSRRISDMSENIKAQLISQLQSSLLTIQLDEAMDISKEAHLIAYVWYCPETSIKYCFIQQSQSLTFSIGSEFHQPFVAEAMSLSHLSDDTQEELIELQSELTLDIQFKNQSLGEFWLKVGSEYPALSKIAIKALLPFGSSYLCEIGFSALAVLKTKYC
ncbi:F200A protein, partial [Polyodon spathula]|nr:F200A protein [Polyodon spathula]